MSKPTYRFDHTKQQAYMVMPDKDIRVDYHNAQSAVMRGLADEVKQDEAGNE